MRLPLRIPHRDTAPFDVVAFGQNSVDLVAVVAGHPARNAKYRLERFARLPGGEMATAAAVCARLGWRARYVGSFGDDDLAEVGRRSLAAEGVDLSASWTVSGTTSQFAVVIVDQETGERTVLWDRPAALTMRREQVTPATVTSGRVLLLDANDTAAATRAAGCARAAGIPTVADVETVQEGIADLLSQVDAIIAAEPFPRALTGIGDPGAAIAALQREFKAPLVAVTLGERGSLTLCGGRETHTPAFAVTCVDSTGAGDAFHGGFVAACLRAPDGEVADIMRYANAVAALNCRALGARGGMPTASEVDALLMAGSRA
ncbi:MAG TPA: PfkB family carbohydrate kinase [Vicinamibacterales bacterium]|nr:PfkB family carbohydrate kinase [Vicinamibacterales bacterium]